MWAGVLGPYQVSWLLPISASIRSIDDVRPATPIMALSLRVARAARACVSQVGDPVTNMPFGDTEANLLSAIGDTRFLM